MTTRTKQMLRHYSLARRSKVSNGDLFDAHDRRSESIKRLLIPKRHIAWVTILGETLSPVRLRSGRVAILGSQGDFNETCVGKETGRQTRRLFMLSALILAVLCFLMLVCLSPGHNNAKTSAANTHISQGSGQTPHQVLKTIANSNKFLSKPGICQGQLDSALDLLQAKLYNLKSELWRRYRMRFTAQRIIGGVAQAQIVGCDSNLLAKFSKSPEGWQLEGFTKD